MFFSCMLKPQGKPVQNISFSESEHVECRPQGQAMEVPDHNGVGYSRGPQGEVYRSRGQLQRHHTIQTCDDAYVSQTLLLCLHTTLITKCGF